ncbi:MAG: hypothetical protein GX896_10095 [Clostridiales bacterium]|nr:hypothetical protein [Clostridiales bacterium]
MSTQRGGTPHKKVAKSRVAFAKKSADAETVKRFNNLKVKTADDLAQLTESEQNQLLSAVSKYRFDTEFVLNFIAALMATAQYPNKPDVTDLIIEIPPWWIADKTIISELMEFLSLFITEKKNKIQSDGGGL